MPVPRADSRSKTDLKGTLKTQHDDQRFLDQSEYSATKSSAASANASSPLSRPLAQLRVARRIEAIRGHIGFR